MSSSRRVCQPRAFPITASVTFEISSRPTFAP